VATVCGKLVALNNIAKHAGARAVVITIAVPISEPFTMSGRLDTCLAPAQQGAPIHPRPDRASLTSEQL